MQHLEANHAMTVAQTLPVFCVSAAASLRLVGFEPDEAPRRAVGGDGHRTGGPGGDGIRGGREAAGGGPGAEVGGTLDQDGCGGAAGRHGKQETTGDRGVGPGQVGAGVFGEIAARHLLSAGSS